MTTITTKGDKSGQDYAEWKARDVLERFPNLAENQFALGAISLAIREAMEAQREACRMAAIRMFEALGSKQNIIDAVAAATVTVKPEEDKK